MFSADVTRHADQEELAAYEEQISKLETKSVQQLGGAKFSESVCQIVTVLQFYIFKCVNWKIFFFWVDYQEKMLY